MYPACPGLADFEPESLDPHRRTYEEQCPSRKAAFSTSKDAASYLAICTSHLYNLMERGELPYIKIGSCRRIRPEDLNRFVAASTIGPRAR